MPSGSGLKIDARRKKILELLEQDRKVRIADLSHLLGATVVTIRNDLDELERAGKLERVQGGAVLRTDGFEHLPGNYFESRRGERVEEKRLIAAKTASLIREGDTVFINSGTTTYYIALELKKLKNLNIVTNSLYIAMELSGVATFRVKLLGGDINDQYLFTYGNEALEQLRSYNADKSILSVSGICTGGTGITTFHAEEASLDQLMMERSRETIVAADSTKLGYEGFCPVAPLERIAKCVTDAGAAEKIEAQYRQAGVEWIIAS